MGEKVISVNKCTKILVPATSYDFKSDKRLLVPFTSGDKIGFINKNGEVVVKPQYAMYYGECYSESDYVRVAQTRPYSYPRGNNKVALYKRVVYGLINFKGEEVFPLEYQDIVPSLSDSSIFTVKKMDGP